MGKKSKKHRIKAREAWCPNPHCRALLTGYTALGDDLDGRAARAGDITVCGYCGAICTYTNNRGELRAATPADMEGLDLRNMIMLTKASRFFRAMRRIPEQRRTN